MSSQVVLVLKAAMFLAPCKRKLNSFPSISSYWKSLLGPSLLSVCGATPLLLLATICFNGTLCTGEEEGLGVQATCCFHVSLGVGWTPTEPSRVV